MFDVLRQEVRLVSAGGLIMIRRSTEVYALLILLVAGPLFGSECELNWFGYNCDMQCHCATAGCERNGDCRFNAACERGYFGPACQYVDLGKITVPSDNPAYLSDNDVTTCNDNKRAKSVTFNLTKYYRFYWLRLIVYGPGLTKTLELKLNGMNDSCHYERYSVIGEYSMDIMCETTMLVSFVILEGDIAPYVCAVHISGGRNLALKNIAYQSTTDMPGTSMAVSMNSVDGNTSGNFQDNSCSQTNAERNGSTWHMLFFKPQILYRVRIYNRDDFRYRLQGFTLRTFNTYNDVINTFVDDAEPIWQWLDINLQSDVLIHKVMITSQTMDKITDNKLTLCEVQIYGETPCSPGIYGLYCNSGCVCTDNSSCATATGGCKTTCPTGYFGFKCTHKCPEMCLNNTCIFHSGLCNQCKPGYTGRTCNDLCNNGTYGGNCSLPCPEFCADGVCHHLTGDCNKCQETHIGPRCEDCPEQKFGRWCNISCSSFCLVTACQNQTGICSQCQESYSGPYCQVSEVSSQMSGILLMIIPFICMAAIMPFVIVKLKNLIDPEPEGTDLNTTTTVTTTTVTTAATTQTQI